MSFLKYVCLRCLKGFVTSMMLIASLSASMIGRVPACLYMMSRLSRKLFFIVGKLPYARDGLIRTVDLMCFLADASASNVRVQIPHLPGIKSFPR